MMEVKAITYFDKKLHMFDRVLNMPLMMTVARY